MNDPIRPRRLPALMLGALLGATAVGALTPAFHPAIAQPAQSGGYADLVARVSPAVVSITVTQNLEAARFDPARTPPGLEEFARRFGLPL
ncbi:MAG: trypsin, partial [Rubrimonas sp.]